VGTAAILLRRDFCSVSIVRINVYASNTHLLLRCKSVLQSCFLNFLIKYFDVNLPEGKMKQIKVVFILFYRHRPHFMTNRYIFFTEVNIMFSLQFLRHFLIVFSHFSKIDFSSEVDAIKNNLVLYRCSL